MTPRDPATTARKSLSCDAKGAPGFNATGEHRQIRSALWPALIGALHGTVVEIGPGAGGNLRYYRPGVRWLGIEPDATARDRTRQEAARRGIRAQVLPGRAEELELDDATVDAVVCSFVLCSVTDPGTVLAEIRRVLKPQGRFVFAEHVAAARGTWVRRAQNLLAVVPTRCRPNRETGPAILNGGFTVVDLHSFDKPGPLGVGVPHITGSVEPTKGQS
jgi:SAM-dependent methyltransferase